LRRKPLSSGTDASEIDSTAGPAKKPRSSRPKHIAKPRATSSRKLPVDTAAVEPTEAFLAINGPDKEGVAHLAYTYWLERGGQGGSTEDDWYRAEQELKARKPA